MTSIINERPLRSPQNLFFLIIILRKIPKTKILDTKSLENYYPSPFLEYSVELLSKNFISF